MTRTRHVARSAAFAALFMIGPAGSVLAGPTLPEIRTTASNSVPGCVTPDRLMSYLKSRNHRLDPRFRDIASYYKQHGDRWRVRWDYAFFQMAIETNFLSYRRPDGRMGDVDPKQNNFAGIGTTGGGVPGDSFPDVSTGVLAQIQHLVVYSGEHVDGPVAPRTQLKQDDILEVSRSLGRTMRFSDLSRRWAVDPRYGQSIEWAASEFRNGFCKGGDKPVERTADAAEPVEVLPWQRKEEQTKALPTPSPRPAVRPSPDAGKSAAAKPASTPVAPAKREADKPAQAGIVRTIWVASPRGTPSAASAAAAPAAGETEGTAAASNPSPLSDAVAKAGPPSGLGMKPSDACSIRTASYGGKKTILIGHNSNGATHLTALTVLDGFERSMTDTFIRTHAPGAEALGEYPTKEDALAKARETCPNG